MADGLLGSITPDDKMLGLLGIGLGMLANARGRNSRDAFQNSLGGAVEGGMGMLGPIMQSNQQQAMREMQARQMGLQERQVGAQEELNKMHAKLYGAQVADLERTQALLSKYLGGDPMAASAGMGTPPTLTPGPDGTQIGTPGTQPPIQARGLNAAAPGVAPAPVQPAGKGDFNIPPDLVKALAFAKPQMAGPFMEMFKADQPSIDYIGGIAVDKKTGRPVQGAPTLPQMSQPGLGYQNMPDPSSPTGYRVVPVPGGLELLASQKGTAAGAEAAATAPYGAPREVKLPDGRTVLMRPDQFTAMAGGVPQAPAGTPSPRVTQPGAGATVNDRVRILEGELPNASASDRPILIQEINRVRKEAGMPAYQEPTGMPGLVSGKTTAQTIDDKRTEAGAVNQAELGQRRIADLQKEATGQQSILNMVSEIEQRMNNGKGVLGAGLLDRGRMVAHEYGVQNDSTVNTRAIRQIGEQLVLARGSLGAGVSTADADRYEKAAGAFTKAKSVADMQESISIMKSIAQKYFDQTNAEIGGYRTGNGNLLPVGPNAPQQQRSRDDILKQYGVR